MEMILENCSMRPSLPLSRVELHVHLDGCIRPETIWEIAHRKQIKLPGNGSLCDLKDAIKVKNPSTLSNYLSKFSIWMSLLIGDLKNIERIAYEFTEDCTKNGILYVEARFCPEMWVPKGKTEDNIRTDDIVEAVLNGFKKGEMDFKLKARLLLCSIIGFPEGSKRDILRLARKYSDRGVVGIDVAGDEKAMFKPGSSGSHDSETIEVFQEANKLGIHRTVHAGEDGPASAVRAAVRTLHAERIGHGYHVLEDIEIYQECLDKKIHFECCPTSSFLTGSVPLSTLKHPIVEFASNSRTNFSINTDNTCIHGGAGLEHDFKVVNSWGLNEVTLVRCTFNAARSCFLPLDEKKELLKDLRKIYGIDMN